jgi:hypothetical protein
MAEKRAAEGANFGLLWSAFRAARRRGEGLSDALRTATDDMVAFDKTGKLPEHEAPVVRPKPQAPPLSSTQRIVGLTQTVLINAVTVIGVFQLRWTVGTGLGLYWAETFLTAIAVGVLYLVWRFGRADDLPANEIGQLIGVSFAFNFAHFLFLLFLLAAILPKNAPAERFDRPTFLFGLGMIAILLGVDFMLNLFTIRAREVGGVYDLASRYMQRVGVLHLTIIFGMLAMALIGSARALFAVFSGLKLLVDVTRRL